MKMSNSAKITAVRVTKLPQELTDPLPGIYVRFDDGEEEFLFSYYPDEIQFTVEELMGLTREEAIKLKSTKYRDFLQDP